MSEFSSLKAAASAKLVSADSTVKTYVAQLEASINANRLLVIGVGLVGLVVGGVIGHLI